LAAVRPLWQTCQNIFEVTIISIIAACTSVQTQENTLEQIATLEQIRYSQILTNLSNAIDESNTASQRYPIPSQGVTSSGTATAVTTGTLAFTLTQPFAFARNTKTFTPMASVNWQNNWTVIPISDPQDLQNLRSLYGLLYRTDHDVAQFVIDTLTLFAAQNRGNIDIRWRSEQAQYCGLLQGNENTYITDPYAAAASYFGAWNAFPARAQESKCYATNDRPLGVTNSALAEQYGLAYPSKQEVLASLRNGLSPGCRRYQEKYLVVYDVEHPNKQWFRQDTLFARWLFWKDSSGNWQPPYPNGPPPDSTFEYLGKYGNHDFWTTSAACLNDFIVLAINATVNSHAAAQNSQKGGTTPASLGTQ
jgi:hypothetical protein